MPTPPWREAALEILPEFRSALQGPDIDNPYTFWFEVREAFESAYDESPPNESLIQRIYSYCDWCINAPRGQSAEDDLFTCVAVCFLEHIPEHPLSRADMPRWFTFEELVGSESIFSYMIGPEEFSKLKDYFSQNRKKYVQWRSQSETKAQQADAGKGSEAAS